MFEDTGRVRKYAVVNYAVARYGAPHLIPKIFSGRAQRWPTGLGLAESGRRPTGPKREREPPASRRLRLAATRARLSRKARARALPDG